MKRTACSGMGSGAGVWFLQPVDKVAVDIGLFFIINAFVVGCLMILVKNTTAGVIGTVWVAIITWRGGIPAGILGTCAIHCSTTMAHFILSLHELIPMSCYFNDQIPCWVFGFLINVFISFVGGYVSTLIHQLRHEIHLRMLAEEELKRKVAELDAFGHTLAHNLKNPLIVISGSVTALQKERALSGNRARNSKLLLINECSKQMMGIIESLLLLAGIKKIEPGEFGFFQMGESVSGAIRRMENKIVSNNVSVHGPDVWPVIFGYAPWITEVWVSCIENAIESRNPSVLNGRPVVTLGYDNHEHGGHIRFWVRGNNWDSAQERTGVIFTESATIRKPGVRRGVCVSDFSIVNLVAKKFNGAAGVENEPEKGCLFYFTLPVTDTPALRRMN